MESPNQGHRRWSKTALEGGKIAAKVGFRPPVLISKSVVNHLCRLARDGNEARRRHETFGFLFGAISKRKLVIRKAVFYRGGKKTQTGVLFIGQQVDAMEKRRRDLAAIKHLRFVGCFHSHMVVDNDIYKGASEADIFYFKDDKPSKVDVIVFVWNNDFVRRSSRDVAIHRTYDFRIRCYGRKKGKVRQVKVRYE